MQKNVRVRFERVDTVNENGTRYDVARSYYFDKNRENLLLITVYENQPTLRKGSRFLYTFSGNRLIKARVMPAKTVCHLCHADYYFSNDSMVYKNELSFSFNNSFLLLDDSKKLASKVLSKAQ